MEKDKEEEETKLIDRFTQQVIGPFPLCVLSACVSDRCQSIGLLWFL